MDGRHKGFDFAAEIKKKGGIPIEYMRDFLVDEDSVYSFEKLRSFDYVEMKSKSTAPDYCQG